MMFPFHHVFGLLAAASFLFLAPSARGGKVLFDATKSEWAGNADWVIDSDSEIGGGSNPARFPTPAQSGITASTPETYWKGAISSWGLTMVKHGNTVESLPRTGAITYGNASNAQDLSHYKTYVVCEPNSLFSLTEKTAIVNFVKDGGGLFIVSDHDVSDRDNDGVDSVDAWNDLFTNNGVTNNPFGISVNTGAPTSLSNFSQVSTNLSATAPFKTGTEGTAANLEFNNGTTFTLTLTANSTVAAAVWQNGTTASSNVMMAYASYGLGRVVALGDSSPADDGTGDTGDNLFTGWSTGTNGVLIANATDWVGASLQSTYDAGSGSWATAASWTGVVPDSQNTVVDFKSATAADATVTLDRARSVDAIRFSSANSYAIVGTSTLKIGPAPTETMRPGVYVTAGSHSILAPLLTTYESGFGAAASSSLTISQLTTTGTSGITIGGAGTFRLGRIDGLSYFSVVQGSTFFIGEPTATASSVGNLMVVSGATVDLGRTPLTVEYATLTPQFAAIKGYIRDQWLKTSAPGLVIGYALASDLNVTTFAGQAVNPRTLLIRATLAGDANLDLVVDFGDLVRLAQHYNLAGAWSDGDFDRSGTVDFADLVSLAQHYNASAGASAMNGAIDGASGSSFASDWSLAQSFVPEPALGLSGLFLLIPRRRRSRNNEARHSDTLRRNR